MSFCTKHGADRVRDANGKLLCRQCVIDRSKRWYAANRERAKATSKRWNDANRDKVRAIARACAERSRRAKGTPARSKMAPEVRERLLRERNWKRSGIEITFDQFEALFASQGGRCQICRRVPGDTLHVDHCHTTKVIRGLLCGECNRGLGNFRDCTQLLTSAIEYLRGATAPSAPRS